MRPLGNLSGQGSSLIIRLRDGGQEGNKRGESFMLLRLYENIRFSINVWAT